MVRLSPLILGIGVLLLYPSTSLSDIYSFTDKNGVVNFTNVPTDPRYKLIIKERHFDPRSINYGSLISRISGKYMVEDTLVRAIIKAESDFNHKAVSNKGAMGLMQLMPGTAEDMDVKNPFNPEENIEGGVRYFKWLLNRFKDNLPLAIAAYHAGGDAVIRYGGIPPFDSTQKYVKQVLKYFKEYKK
ncbi:MAG: lytic transglycosylase [Deltaproteobacteria bacterium CG06_land_8_20_14_3_00_44_19]|nr:MAG: lytic transglycosylase [Deltaproteobacteria bacterium CG06_land_8_20_14_3_00_44_19]